jgi:hypothetical protein
MTPFDYINGAADGPLATASSLTRCGRDGKMLTSRDGLTSVT